MRRSGKVGTCSTSSNGRRPYNKKKDPQEKVFKCNECNSTFPRKTALTIHTLRQHPTENPYKCEKCNCKFKLRKALKLHMFTEHHVQPRYSCHLCGATFERNMALLSHLRAHRGEKPFKCEVCGKQFGQKGNMKAHMRLHTGEEPFKCPDCGVAFKQLNSLQRHILIIHKPSSPIKQKGKWGCPSARHSCGHCSALFNTKMAFLRHVRLKHCSDDSVGNVRLKKSQELSLQTRSIHSKFLQIQPSTNPKVATTKRPVKRKSTTSNDNKSTIKLSERKSDVLHYSGLRHVKIEELRQDSTREEQCFNKGGPVLIASRVGEKKFCKRDNRSSVLINNTRQNYSGSVNDIQIPNNSVVGPGSSTLAISHRELPKRKPVSSHSHSRTILSAHCGQSSFQAISRDDMKLGKQSRTNVAQKKLKLLKVQRSLSRSHKYAASSRKPLLYECKNCSSEFKRRIAWLNHTCSTIGQSARSIKTEPQNEPPGIQSSTWGAIIPHSCKLCEAKYKYSSHLQNHVITVHGASNKRHSKKPQDAFRGQVQILETNPIYGSELIMYRCDHCSAKFELRCLLLNHIRLVHRSAMVVKLPSNANTSNLEFKEVPNVFNYKSKIALYKCEQCNYRFKNKNRLQSHVRRMHSASGTSDEKVSSSSKLNKPLLQICNQYHRNKKQSMFKCEQCNAKYTKHRYLQYHIKNRHPPEMPICNSDYNGKKRAPYKCGRCTAVYKQHRNLLSHIRRMHQAERPICNSQNARKRQSQHKCGQCSAKYKHLFNLLSHIRQKHQTEKLPGNSKLAKTAMTKTATKQNVRTQFYNEKEHLSRDEGSTDCKTSTHLLKCDDEICNVRVPQDKLNPVTDVFHVQSPLVHNSWHPSLLPSQPAIAGEVSTKPEQEEHMEKTDYAPPSQPGSPLTYDQSKTELDKVPVLRSVGDVQYKNYAQENVNHTLKLDEMHDLYTQEECCEGCEYHRSILSEIVWRIESDRFANLKNLDFSEVSEVQKKTDGMDDWHSCAEAYSDCEYRREILREVIWMLGSNRLASYKNQDESEVAVTPKLDYLKQDIVHKTNFMTSCSSEAGVKEPSPCKTGTVACVAYKALSKLNLFGIKILEEEVTSEQRVPCRRRFPYRCSQCCMAFSHSRGLMKHGRLNHARKEWYKCEMCEASYQNYINRHAVVYQVGLCSEAYHVGEPVANFPVNDINRQLQHNCGKCSTSFGHRKDFHNHLLVHAAERGEY